MTTTDEPIPATIDTRPAFLRLFLTFAASDTNFDLYGAIYGDDADPEKVRRQLQSTLRHVAINLALPYELEHLAIYHQWITERFVDLAKFLDRTSDY